jgi:hypothetical protein
VDNFFDHGGGFKGVTGYYMRPLTEEEIEERNSEDNYIEYYREIWKECVRTDQTEYGLYDFVKDSIQYEPGLFPGDDPSYRDEAEEIISKLPQEFQEKIKELCGEYQTWECSGCGRCFSKDMEFDFVFDNEVLKKIQEIEK